MVNTMTIITTKTNFNFTQEYHVEYPRVTAGYRIFEDGEKIQLKWAHDAVDRKTYTDSKGEYIKINGYEAHKTIKFYK